METSVRTDDKIRRAARGADGVISRQVLMRVGLSDDAIRWQVKTGRIVVIFPGVYAVGHAALTRRAVLAAALLAAGPRAALSHRTAAAHWGLMDPVATVEVVRSSSPDRPNSKLQRGPRGVGPRLVIHRTRVLAASHFTKHRGLPVTTVARTLVDMAGLLSHRRLESLVTEAERLDLVRERELAVTVEECGGKRGIRKLKDVLGWWDPRLLATRSDLEERFLALCRDHGLPAPRVNVAVEGMEVDALWPERGLIVELDGYRYHRSLEAFERDRERTIALEASGYRVMRLTHRMVAEEAAATAERIRDRLRLREAVAA